MTAVLSLDARFDAKVAVVESGCWEWTAGRQSAGYGVFWLGRTTPILAHRYAWQRAHGDIPAGRVIDHLCRNRRCVNVAHLDLVTPGENTRRGPALIVSAERHRAQTHCKNGHAFTPANTAPRRDHPGRRCRTCAAASARRSYRRARAAA